MIIPRTLVILIGVMGSMDCERMKPTSVKFIRITSTFNPRNIEFFDIFITPGSNGQSFEMDCKLITNVSNELHVAVNLLMRSQVKDSYKMIFSYDFDVCRVWGSFMRQTIAKLWFKNLRKYSNLPTTCPVPEGRYYVKKMRIDTRSVPMFVVSGDYMVNATMYIKRGLVKDFITNSSLEVEIQKS